MIKIGAVFDETCYWDYPIDLNEDKTIFWSMFTTFSLIELCTLLIVVSYLMSKRYFYDFKLPQVLVIYVGIIGISYIIMNIYYFKVYANRNKGLITKHVFIDQVGISHYLLFQDRDKGVKRSNTSYKYITAMILQSHSCEVIYFDSYIRKNKLQIPEEIYNQVCEFLLSNSTEKTKIIYRK